MPGTKEPRWGISLAARSWQCPGPHPSLTMMATPENMTAETSCQTLRGREDRGPGVSMGAIPLLTLHEAFLAACLVISLHPPSWLYRGSHKPPAGGLSSPQLQLQHAYSLTQAEEGNDPDKRVAQMGLPRRHMRPGAPPAPTWPLQAPSTCCGTRA